MSPQSSTTTMLLIWLAYVLQVQGNFRGLTPKFVGVDVNGPVHHHGHHDDQHGNDHHSNHSHDDHHHEEHHETKHDGHHGGSVSGSAKSVAMGLMAFVILTPLVMSMLMTQKAGGQLAYFTIRMIDMATSIFLAVLFFGALGKVVKAIFPHSVVRAGVVMVFVLYVLTMVGGYTLRENKNSLFIFCSIAAHCIAFAAIHVAGEAQHRSGKLVEHEVSYGMSFGFCIFLFVIFALVSLVCFYAWRKHVKNLELNVAIDELEADVAGLVLSFAVMQAVRHTLTGHYPAPAHFLLLFAIQHEDGGHGHATEAQRMEMLMCSLGFTLLACFSLWLLEYVKEQTHYWMHKFLHVVEVVLVMCSAWGYLLWGAWSFTETDFHGDKMFGNMIFAVIATCISLFLITGLAFASNGFASVKDYARLCIMAISLVTAWSWEHCFQTAIGIVAQEYQVGYGGLVPRILIAIIVPLSILPGYIVFLKPVVIEKTSKFEEEEEETEARDLAEMGVNSSPQRSGVHSGHNSGFATPEPKDS